MIGNGLTMAFRSHAAPHLDAWHPSQPLDWAIMTPDQAGVPFLDNLPRLKRALAEVAPAIAKTQFHRLLLAVDRADAEAEFVSTEARHFIAIAYSYLQEEVERVPDSIWADWPWIEFFNRVGHNLQAAVCFNYERMLETLLDRVDIRYRRVGIPSERHSLPIAKPQGSIDFDVTHLDVPLGYPLDGATDLINLPLRRLRSDQWLRPRAHAELVPPNRSSEIRSFQWVNSGYRAFAHKCRDLDRCLFVCISYDPVDRAEIDHILSLLPHTCAVVIANPDPVEELQATVRAQGKQVEHWPGEPDLALLPSRGRLVGISLYEKQSRPQRTRTVAAPSTSVPPPMT